MPETLYLKVTVVRRCVIPTASGLELVTVELPVWDRVDQQAIQITVPSSELFSLLPVAPEEPR